MDEWLLRARDAIAAAANIPADQLELDEGREAKLLDLARIAAHESGERTNAPLLCYLVGRAEQGVALDALMEVVRGMNRR
jgi:Domain of unknown function (DUF6457)